MKTNFSWFHGAALSMAFVLVAPEVSAWGDEGHEIVGYAASTLLSVKAKKAVHDLLAHDPDERGRPLERQLQDCATWPDRVKHKESIPSTVFARFDVHFTTETDTFHYADLTGDKFDQSRDCADHQCIVEGIDVCVETLANPKVVVATRIEAFKFLVHLVGDIHQPLHSGRRKDKGGLGINPVYAPGDTGNLHHIWDATVINAAKLAPEQYGIRRVLPIIAQNQLTYANDLKAVNWVAETHQIAMHSAYVDEKGKQIEDNAHLSPKYIENAQEIPDVQLAKAAVRLAALIEQAMVKSTD